MPLISLLKEKGKTRTYLIAYSAPIARNMQYLNYLSYYTIPSIRHDKFPAWLTVELGIFSGRLYFDFEKEHSLLQLYFGDESAAVSESLSIPGDNVSSESHGRKFAQMMENPVDFLYDWLALRRKIQDITHTPMGYLCQGKPLSKNHAFFANAEESGGKSAGIIESVGYCFNSNESNSQSADSDDSSDFDEYSMDLVEETV